ncbi:MAG: IS3 family transposase [Eubacteriales bacterium]|nr:IS3 family transposase [Eubacteriales bacterium]
MFVVLDQNRTFLALFIILLSIKITLEEKFYYEKSFIIFSIFIVILMFIKNIIFLDGFIDFPLIRIIINSFIFISFVDKIKDNKLIIINMFFWYIIGCFFTIFYSLIYKLNLGISLSAIMSKRFAGVNNDFNYYAVAIAFAISILIVFYFISNNKNTIMLLTTELHSHRIKQALENNGLRVGLRRIKRLMHENGWLHETKRNSHGITKADNEAHKAENLIARDFSADKPNEKLLTDISEVQCSDGKLYISPIMDCYNGEIIALGMDDNMKKELVVSTLESAAKKYNLAGAIIHSDRGRQYTSAAFRKRLGQLEIRQSMSGTGRCYDNARMENGKLFCDPKKGEAIPYTNASNEDGTSKDYNF